MNIKALIPETSTYQRLVKATPFLKTTLLKKSTTDSIERIIYQIKKLGEDYIQDKNYQEREVLIAKEIIELNTNSQC